MLTIPDSVRAMLDSLDAELDNIEATIHQYTLEKDRLHTQRKAILDTCDAFRQEASAETGASADTSAKSAAPTPCMRTILAELKKQPGKSTAIAARLNLPAHSVAARLSDLKRLGLARNDKAEWTATGT